MSANKPKGGIQSNSNIPKSVSSRSMTLQQIFVQNHSLGWQVLDAESLIYTETDISMQKISYLTTLYMKIIQKLNTMQDTREKYFTFKMQKLMSEPYIIRCFNNQHDSKRSALEDRRKILEQKIEQEAERQNHKKIVEKAIQVQTQKEERVRNKIKTVIEQSDKLLEERIRGRAMRRLQRSMEMSPSSINNSADLASQDSINSSGGSLKERLMRNKSSDFQLMIQEQERFKAMKREIDEEEQEERLVRKMFRGVTLPEKEG